MLARRRRARRARRRASAGDAAWLVGVSFACVLLLRTLNIYDTVVHDSCESLLFWLDGWEQGRSLLQVTGALLAALVGLWGVWLTGSGPVVPKLAVGVLLLALLTAFDRQARLYLPDHPHPLADASDAFVPAPELWFGDERRSFFSPIIRRAEAPTLDAAMRADPLAGWQTSHLIGPSVISEDGLTVTRFLPLTRRRWLVGADAPTHRQMTAIRACVAYNQGLPARRAALLAAEPGAREGYDYGWDGVRFTYVLPPLVNPPR